MPRLLDNLFPSFDRTTPRWLISFADEVIKQWANLAQLLNGLINFGDGTNRDNIDGAWCSATAPAVANTDFTLTHNLGRVPVGYWIMRKDRAADVYTGSVASSTTQLTLRCDVADAVLVIFVV